MYFLNHKGRKYSFILLLVILHNSYADDVKDQVTKLELKNAEDQVPLRNLDNVPPPLKMSKPVDQVLLRDLNNPPPPPKITKSVESSILSQEPDEINVLDEGFIVLPLKSRRIMMEGLTIPPNARPVLRSANQHPMERFPEIVLPAMDELEKIKEVAIKKRIADQKNKQNIELIEVDTTVPPPLQLASRRSLSKEPSTDKVYPKSSMLKKGRVIKTIDTSTKEKRHDMPKMPALIRLPIDFANPSPQKRMLKSNRNFDQTEEIDISLPIDMDDYAQEEDFNYDY